MLRYISREHEFTKHTEAYIFIKKKPHHRCFPMKFAKILTATILKIICERLFLLCIMNVSTFTQQTFTCSN